jgi:hypothetical protein
VSGIQRGWLFGADDEQVWSVTAGTQECLRRPSWTLQCLLEQVLPFTSDTPSWSLYCGLFGRTWVRSSKNLAGPPEVELGIGLGPACVEAEARKWLTCVEVEAQRWALVSWHCGNI